jgi:hypothetical protein
MAKSTKNTKVQPEVKAPVVAPPVAIVAAPVPTPDLLAQLRAAKSLDDAVTILAPAVAPKAKAQTVYEVNATCAEPLPQKRGACLKVYAVAARLNAPFKVADIAAALPDVKAAPYWTRRLARTGHFSEVV